MDPKRRISTSIGRLRARTASRANAAWLGRGRPRAPVRIGLESRCVEVLIHRDPRASEQLRAEIARVLECVHDPQDYERRLFDLAGRDEILDEIALVRLVNAQLPPDARRARAAGYRVLRRLHVAAAWRCDLAGYQRLAAMHLFKAALADPSILFRRRSLGIIRRWLLVRTERNQLLRQEALAIFRLFNKRGVRACVFGSLAVSLQADRFIKRHGDIDLVFPSAEDTNRAAALLVSERKYRVLRRVDWIGLNGKPCFQIALRGPRDIPIELSYLPENPDVEERRRTVQGISIATPDLHGLRDIYALFLVKKAAASSDTEKQAKKCTILAIDRLLAARRARAMAR
ncbi:MAG TPA: hypothetical protein VF329_15795 [Gammaproteobacteria bacterium]